MAASLSSTAATVTTAASFRAPARRHAAVTSCRRPSSAVTVRASLGMASGARTAAVAAAASALLLAAAGSAMAQEVLLGDNGGGLVFEPSEFTIKAGDTITFKNNAGYPHNVVFDEDEVPSGVDAAKISQEELLNAAGEIFSVTLTVPGTYSFYCEPHQGAGMVGKVTVN